ncbi:MAG: plasmid replication, integration and excision activator [Actinomycetes bacterium]
MAIQGPIEVPFEQVFPHGGFLHGDVSPMRDFEKSTPESPVQATDKQSGELVWAVDVIDADPQARSKTVRVKIAAPVQPVPPEAVAGMPFRPVAFEGFSVTPYVDSNTGRLAYSFRARGMRAPSAKDAGSSGTTTSSASTAGAAASSSAGEKSSSGSSSKQAA